MPQHDLILDNGSGAAFRSDANSALEALGTMMKGPNAPPSPRNGMLWLDDDTPSATVWTVKQYDGAEWIEWGRLDIINNAFIPSEGVIAWADVASAATVDLGAQASRSLRLTGTTTISSFGTAPSGLRRRLRIATGLTIVHNATNLFCPGAANLVLAAGDVLEVESLGSGNWVVVDVQRAAALPLLNSMATGRVLGRVSAATGAIEEIPLGNNAAALSLGINRGVEQATNTGQVQYDFTGIPAGVRRITVMLRQVSTNGSASYALRLGTSGGIISANYDSSWSYDAPGVGGASFGSTNHFGIYNGGAADITSGIVTLVNQSGNLWLFSFAGILAAGAGRFRSYSAGFIDLGAALTQLRLTTDGGAPTFDNGSFNMKWEF